LLEWADGGFEGLLHQRETPILGRTMTSDKVIVRFTWLPRFRATKGIDLRRTSSPAASHPEASEKAKIELSSAHPEARCKSGRSYTAPHASKAPAYSISPERGAKFEELALQADRSAAGGGRGGRRLQGPLKALSPESLMKW